VIRLNDEFIPPPDEDEGPSEITELVRLLQQGRPAEKQKALLKLIAAGAEEELTDCLGSADALAAQLATAGLWECWLNEEGPEARERIDQGIDLMEAGQNVAAEKIFLTLSRQYPGWAEPINKQATSLYMRGLAANSFDLCQLVVEMKPNHFGAWHGLALCAVQMEDWETALDAAKEALRLQPRAAANREIIRLAKSKLRGA
jgi:tetratricopeptide (TPR) repeat protein